MEYGEISKIMDLDKKKDKEAAKILDKLIEEPDLTKLEKLLVGKDVIVFGAGPSLKEDILNVKGKRLHEESTIIAADGAAKALIENRIFPHVLVTDLDGDESSILQANKHGTVTIVHAHGDNIPQLKRLVPSMKDVIGTTQCEEFGKMNNFGGFTDGDRAVFLAEYFSADTIILAGMDFGKDAGPYSGKETSEKKLKKLEIGKKLIEELAKSTEATILNVTKKGEYILGVPKISIEDLTTLLGFD